jgi:hypothetical protein
MAPCGMWSTSSTWGLKLIAAARISSLRTLSTSGNGMASDTGDQSPGPIFRIEGSLRCSWPGAAEKNWPMGESQMVSTLAPGWESRNSAASRVVRRRWPSPSPSWE